MITGISSIILALTSGGESEERAPGDVGTNTTTVDVAAREGPAAHAGGPNSYAYVFR